MEGQVFGPYRLGTLLGRGGMGEVYRAVDTRKRDRVVALKRLPRHLAADPAYQARFRREAELAAMIREPHVIPIHDYGEIDGQLFIDMRLVDGMDLGAVLTAVGPLPSARVASIVTQVAAALDAAHADGLVHRDVKPSNVLLTGGDGAEFVYLVDFGIARPAAAGSLTASGAVVGSPHYMAPERFLGDETDRLVDVYGLGCVVHECLTGHKPFPGDGLGAQMYGHMHLAPPRPSDARIGVPTGFDAVVARSMAKDPGQRFRSAGELAHAVRTVIAAAAQQPGSERGSAEPTPGPTTTSAETVRPAWLRRHLVPLGAAGVVVAASLSALAVFHPRAEPASLPTDSGPTVTGTIPVGVEPNGVTVSPDGRRIFVANLGSDSVSVIDPTDDSTYGEVAVGDEPVRLALSPDGRTLYVSNQASDSVSVIDTGTTGVVGTIAVGDGPFGVAITPDGSTVYVANAESNSVSVIDPAINLVTGTIAVRGRPSMAAVTPDGRTLYVTGTASVSVIDTRTGAVTGTISVGGASTGLAVTPDGRHAYVANYRSASVSVIDTGTNAVTATIPVLPSPNLMAITPDGRYVYVTNLDQDSVSIIDTLSNTVSTVLDVGSSPIGVAITPSGDRAYVADNDSGAVSVIETGG